MHEQFDFLFDKNMDKQNESNVIDDLNPNIIFLVFPNYTTRLNHDVINIIQYFFKKLL